MSIEALIMEEAVSTGIIYGKALRTKFKERKAYLKSLLEAARADKSGLIKNILMLQTRDNIDRFIDSMYGKAIAKFISASSGAANYAADALRTVKKGTDFLYEASDYIFGIRIPEFIRVYSRQAESGFHSVKIEFIKMGKIAKSLAYRIRSDAEAALHGAAYFLRMKGYSTV